MKRKNCGKQVTVYLGRRVVKEDELDWLFERYKEGVIYRNSTKENLFREENVSRQMQKLYIIDVQQKVKKKLSEKEDRIVDVVIKKETN